MSSSARMISASTITMVRKSSKTSCAACHSEMRAVVTTSTKKVALGSYFVLRARNIATFLGFMSSKDKNQGVKGVSKVSLRCRCSKFQRTNLSSTQAFKPCAPFTNHHLTHKAVPARSAVMQDRIFAIKYQAYLDGEIRSDPSKYHKYASSTRSAYASGRSAPSPSRHTRGKVYALCRASSQSNNHLKAQSATKSSSASSKSKVTKCQPRPALTRSGAVSLSNHRVTVNQREPWMDAFGI